MKVSDPRDDPVFTISLPFSFSDTLYFRSRCLVSRLVSRTEIYQSIGRNYQIEKTRARFHPHWLSFNDESEPRIIKIARHVSSYFQGAQGEPGTKGERGDPGLPVSLTLYQVFIRRSNLIHLTRDIARFARVYRDLSAMYLKIYRVYYLEAILPFIKQ